MKNQRLLLLATLMVFGLTACPGEKATEEAEKAFEPGDISPYKNEEIGFELMKPKNVEAEAKGQTVEFKAEGFPLVTVTFEETDNTSASGMVTNSASTLSSHRPPEKAKPNARNDASTVVLVRVLLIAYMSPTHIAPPKALRTCKGRIEPWLQPASRQGWYHNQPKGWRITWVGSNKYLGLALSTSRAYSTLSAE